MVGEYSDACVRRRVNGWVLYSALSRGGGSCFWIDEVGMMDLWRRNH